MKLLSNLLLALILFSASITESQALQSQPVQLSLAGQFEHVAEQETSGRTQKFVVTSRRDAIRKAKGRYQGKVLKAGKRLVVSDVTVYSEGNEKAVAHAIGTYSIPPRD